MPNRLPLLAIQAVLLASLQAGAASLTIYSSASIVSPGETFTITVEGVIEAGDIVGSAAKASFSYDETLFHALGTTGPSTLEPDESPLATPAANRLTSYDGQLRWHRGWVEGNCGVFSLKSQSEYCYAIDQIVAPSVDHVDTQVIRATFDFMAIAPSGASGSFDLFEAIWFGRRADPWGIALPPPEGWEFEFDFPEVTVTIAPEPSTSALVGLGLLAIAATRRARR